MNSRINDNYFIKKLFTKGKIIYEKCPFFIRFIFLPFEKIFWLLSVIRLDLWHIKGKEISSQRQLAISYAGIEENKNLFIKIFFNDSYQENYTGKIWIWNIRKIIKRSGCDISLMITELPKSFQKLFKNHKGFLIPSWIFAGLDISEDFNCIITKSRCFKSDRQKINKKNLNYEISTDLQQYYNFYHEMYLPHITKAYGDCASLLSLDFMEKQFKKCDLLLLKKDNDCIGGMLINYEKNDPHLWVLGIKDGNPEYIEDGSIGALFYFAIHHLKEQGYKKANLGLTRPFLNDGALQFKKKRSMLIFDTSKMCFAIEPLTNLDNLKGFFLNNPFIFIDGKMLHSAIFVENENSFNKEFLEQIYKNYFIPGITNLFIYKFGKVDNKIKESIPAEISEKIILCSAENIFQ